MKQMIPFEIQVMVRSGKFQILGYELILQDNFGSGSIDFKNIRNIDETNSYRTLKFWISGFNVLENNNVSSNLHILTPTLTSLFNYFQYFEMLLRTDILFILQSNCQVTDCLCIFAMSCIMNYSHDHNILGGTFYFRQK